MSATSTRINNGLNNRQLSHGKLDEDAAWRLALSDSSHLAAVEETLVVFARRGFARRLRGRAQEQTEAVFTLDGIAKDHMLRCATVNEYVVRRFGEVRPLEWTRRSLLKAALSLLESLIYHFPGLAILIIMCNETASLEYQSALAASARRTGRHDIIRQTVDARRQSLRHLSTIAGLLRWAPLKGSLSTLIAGIVLRGWQTLLPLCFSSLLAPSVRRAYASIGFEMDAFLDSARDISFGPDLCPSQVHSVYLAVREELDRLSDGATATLCVGPPAGHAIFRSELRRHFGRLGFGSGLRRMFTPRARAARLQFGMAAPVAR